MKTICITYEWTEFDSAEASKLGWDVYNCSGSLDGEYQIQRNDDQDIFGDDLDAWLSFQEYKDIHAKALLFIWQNNRAEWNKIMSYLTKKGIEL